MKKYFLRTLLFILCIPVIMLTACSDKSLKISTYFTETKAVLANNNTASITIDDITGSKPNKDVAREYYQITLVADPDWIYKMFIESIKFKVYTHNSVDSEVVVTITITNAITEYDAKNADLTKLTDEQKIFTQTSSFKPSEKGSVEINFKVNRVLGFANAKTGSTITIDISEYLGGINTNNGNITPLVWTIYSFKIYGESKTYN